MGGGFLGFPKDNGKRTCGVCVWGGWRWLCLLISYRVIKRKREEGRGKMGELGPELVCSAAKPSRDDRETTACLYVCMYV